ncbi:MAG: hypothetical protein FWG56_11940 [Desulfovibrionaceae bacterium]|nr:hypothetical protein [Desulfovibrionaceae bacterium]
MNQISDTAAGTVAAASSKVTTAGAGASIAGAIASDMGVALIGVTVAVLGLLFNIAFKWWDSRAKSLEVAHHIAHINAEEDRANERHQLEVAELNARIKMLESGHNELPPPRQGQAASVLPADLS